MIQEESEAVSRSPVGPGLGGADFGFGTTAKLGRAWYWCMGGVWYGMGGVWYGMGCMGFGYCFRGDIMHGPACPSSQTQIPPHLTQVQQDYMILLLVPYNRLIIYANRSALKWDLLVSLILTQTTVSNPTTADAFFKVGPNGRFVLIEIEITEHTFYLKSCLHRDSIPGPLAP